MYRGELLHGVGYYGYLGSASQQRKGLWLFRADREKRHGVCVFKAGSCTAARVVGG